MVTTTICVLVVPSFDTQFHPVAEPHSKRSEWASIAQQETLTLKADPWQPDEYIMKGKPWGTLHHRFISGSPTFALLDANAVTADINVGETRRHGCVGYQICVCVGGVHRQFRSHTF